MLFYQFFRGGGIGRYTHELASALEARGHVRVRLLCPPDSELLAQAPYETWPHLYDLRHQIPTIRRARFLVGQVVSPFRLLQQAKRDVHFVHLSNINHLSHPLWRRPLRRLGVGIAATVHDVERAISVLNRRYEDAQLQQFYRSSDILFVHGQAQKEELESWAGVNPDRITIVPHGPYNYGESGTDRETLRRRYKIPRHRSVGLFFGRIRDEKNLDQLIRAVSRCDESVHLLVAGASGSGHTPLGHYESLANNLGIGRRVTFREGHVPNHEIPDLFTVADWVALPYGRSFTSQSGVLNIAAWYGRPLLLSNTPTFNETVGSFDIGVSVSLASPDSIQQGVQELTHRVRRGDRFDFEHYLAAHSWARNAALTERAYAEALHRRP